jgi:hypothetical protein
VSFPSSSKESDVSQSEFEEEEFKSSDERDSKANSEGGLRRKKDNGLTEDLSSEDECKS